MTRASDSLTLSYAGSGEDGTGLEPSLVAKRLESLGYVDQAVDIPLSIAPDTEGRLRVAPTPKSVIVIGALGCALFSGYEVNPLWWGLYNWARESRNLSSLV